MATASARERVSTARERLIRPPTLRTSEDEERSASWTELFFDLVYVVAVSRATTILAEDHTAHGIAWFLGIMVLIVWSWMNFVLFTERFDTDDVVHRLFKAVAMAGIAGVALAAPKAPTSFTFEFALSYLVARLALIAMYLRAFRHVTDLRRALATYLVGFAVAAAIWAASLVVADATRPWLWAAAAAVELVTPLIGWRGFGENAFDLRHLSERIGQFMLIVLGEAVLGIVAALANVRLEPPVVLATAGAGVLVFSIWWHNFDVLQRHVPRGHWTAVLIYGVVPVFIGVAALGVTIDLAIEAADEPVAATTRWLLVGALAVYLVLPTAIQVGGTPLELDVATISRLVAAAALVGVGVVGSVFAADTLLVIAAAIFVVQLVIEVSVTASGLRDEQDGERAPG